MVFVGRGKGPLPQDRGPDYWKELAMTNATTTTTSANESKVTRKDALAAAISKFDTTDPIREVLEKMLEQVSKVRNGETPSQAKAKAERHELMIACIDIMNNHPDADINSTWLAKHVNGVRTPQKATALMGMAVKEGLVNKVYQGKKVYYKVA